jgi:hypothetical protein
MRTLKKARRREKKQLGDDHVVANFRVAKHAAIFNSYHTHASVLESKKNKEKVPSYKLCIHAKAPRD